jgi:nitroreductase
MGALRPMGAQPTPGQGGRPRAGYTLAQACHATLDLDLQAEERGVGSGRLCKHRAGSRTGLKPTLPADPLIQFYLYRI